METTFIYSKLIKIGNSHGVTIEPSVLKFHGLKKGDLLKISVRKAEK